MFRATLFEKKGEFSTVRKLVSAHISLEADRGLSSVCSWSADTPPDFAAAVVPAQYCACFSGAYLHVAILHLQLKDDRIVSGLPSHGGTAARRTAARRTGRQTLIVSLHITTNSFYLLMLHCMILTLVCSSACGSIANSNDVTSCCSIIQPVTIATCCKMHRLVMGCSPHLLLAMA